MNVKYFSGELYMKDCSSAYGPPDPVIQEYLFITVNKLSYMRLFGKAVVDAFCTFPNSPIQI